ncbi:MAG: hypothetical protein AAF957_18440 [Planctomycetota bacterium]
MAGFVASLVGGAALACLGGAVAGLLGFMLLLAGVEAIRRGRGVERYREKRRQYHAEERVQHLAAGVVEVTAPMPHGSGEDRRRARIEVLSSGPP